MVALSKIDVRENILRHKGRVLELLLIDQTKTKGKNINNIIWATDSYAELYGSEYGATKPILKEQITGTKKGMLIQPRASKSREEQLKRTKDKAEVFTPLRLVAQMNSEVVRNLQLPDNHTWPDYINAKWLEITCGEGPFIASRYNPTSSRQTIVPLKKRVGFLDSKLQVIAKHVDDRQDWFYHAEIALKACYGYEWQGDNLLIARENILLTMNDFYAEKFNKDLEIEMLEHFAEIISWNIFQMDGLKYVIPMSCHKVNKPKEEQLTLLDVQPTITQEKRQECPGCKYNNPYTHNGKYVKIMDWQTHKPIKFIRLLENDMELK